MERIEYNYDTEILAIKEFKYEDSGKSKKGLSQKDETFGATHVKYLLAFQGQGNLLSLHSHSSLFLVTMGKVGDVRRWWVGLVVEAVLGSDGGGEAVLDSDGGGKA
ncbi:hypothetical protein Tco_1506821 [Tanacetum coccineum]